MKEVRLSPVEGHYLEHSWLQWFTPGFRSNVWRRPGIILSFSFRLEFPFVLLFFFSFPKLIFENTNLDNTICCPNPEPAGFDAKVLVVSGLYVLSERRSPSIILTCSLEMVNTSYFRRHGCSGNGAPTPKHCSESHDSRTGFYWFSLIQRPDFVVLGGSNALQPSCFLLSARIVGFCPCAQSVFCFFKRWLIYFL